MKKSKSGELFQDTRASTAMNEFRDRKAEKQKKFEETNFGPPKPFDMSFIDKEKTHYTMEENFKAYRLFCIMDIDNSGLISLRELRRVLTGTTARSTLLVRFEHPDVGIVWNLDQDDCVVVEHIEDKSPAALRAEVINGLMLLRINECPITPYDRTSLEVLHKEFIRIHDDYMELEFVEPLFIITKFTKSIDIEVYGVIYTAWLPVGAINNYAVMEENIHWALVQAHPALGAIEVTISRKTRRVALVCEEYPFRLMFATGPNFQVSARYALGFSAIDFEESFEHVGDDLVIDLNLGISEKKIDILMEELFGRFDTDGSGEFQFEEFRDFYTKLLANDDCLNTLRAYASHRFRDKLAEKRRNEIYEQRKARAKRRKLMAEKNEKIVADQIARRKANQELCYDGVVRRKYEKRREDQIRVRTVKTTGGGGKMMAEKESKFHPEVKELEKLTSFVNRQKTKDKMKAQEIARKKKLHELMERGVEEERNMKRAQRDVKDRSTRVHMAEMLGILKAAFSRGFQTIGTGVDGIDAIGMNQDVVITPALKLSMNLFSENATVDDVDLEDLDATKMHPVAKRYFFMRERAKDTYDVTKRHPVFFGCDYSREDCRHSSLALGVCRAMLSQRASTTDKRLPVQTKKALAREEMYTRLAISEILVDVVSTIEVRNEMAVKFVQNVISQVKYDLVGEMSCMFDNEECSYTDKRTEESKFLAGGDNEKLFYDDEGNPIFIGERMESVDSATSADDDGTFDASTLPSNRLGADSSYMDTLDCYDHAVDEVEKSSRSVRSESTRGESTRVRDEASHLQSQEPCRKSPRQSQHSVASSGSDDGSLGESPQVAAVIESDQYDFHKDIKESVSGSMRGNSTPCKCSMSDDESQASGTESRNGSNGDSDINSDSSSSCSGSESTTSGSYSGEEKGATLVGRRVLSGEQKDNMYSGLNSSLQEALKQMAAQFVVQQKAMRESFLSSSATITSLIEGDCADNESTATIASLFKNSASVLVRVLMEVAVDRVAHAKLPYGTDLWADSGTKASSSRGKRRKARRGGTGRTPAPATDAIQALVRPKKREGLIFKRASLGAEGAGKMVITGGTSGDYSIASESTALGRTAIKPKNMTLLLHSLTSVQPSERVSLFSRQGVMALSTTQLRPFLVTNVSYSPWKSELFRSSVSGSNASMSTADSTAIGSLTWNKLDANIESWDTCVLRSYQVFHVKIIEGTDSSSYVIADGKITFDEIFERYQEHVALEKKLAGDAKSVVTEADLTTSAAADKPFTFSLKLKCSDVFGGLELTGKLKLTVDINGGDWVFMDRSEEYWNHKRPQHWTTYPITPISTGIVRQKFKDLATQYDKQMLIHPSVWGFCLRYRGNAKDEVKFIHPAFQDFSLVKKPTSKMVLDEIRKQAQLNVKSNPWKYKAGACSICYDGQPGCPRCFNMPVKANGDPSRPEDFQFDPEKEIKDETRRKIREAKKREKEELKLATKRALKAAGELDYDSDESNECSVDSASVMSGGVGDMKIHTTLTTEKGVKLYRNVILHMMKVIVKIMPNGDMRELCVQPQDTIWHLHNMFKTHHELGANKYSMMILPTSKGLFEMDADMTPGNEFLSERNTSYLTLHQYGFRKRGSTLAVFFLPYYKKETLVPLISSYMRENMDVTGLNFIIPSYSHIVGVPDLLEEDIMQVKLVEIMKRQYFDQVLHLKAKYVMLGRDYRIQKQKEADERYKQKQLEKLELDRIRIQEEKELQKQLKGLSEEDQLLKREAVYRERETMVASMTDERQKRAIEKARKAAERQRKLLSKRKESRSEFDRTTSTATDGISSATVSQSTSAAIDKCGHAVSALLNASTDASENEVDDGRNSAVLAGQSLELDGSLIDANEDADSDVQRSKSDLGSVDTAELKQSLVDCKNKSGSISAPSSKMSKSVEIPKLSLHEGSMESGGLGSTNQSMQQSSVTSGAESKKSHGSKRSVSFVDDK